MSENKNNKKLYILTALVCVIGCLIITVVAVCLAMNDEEDIEGTTEAPGTTTAATSESTKPTEPSQPIENLTEQNDNVADDIFAN